MSFKEDYARFGQPGPAREKFVLDTLTRLPRNQVVKTLKPITVTKPDGTKITYEVMPDYISIDGMRVPMSGNTAQRVADHFGLNLPTPKMVDEIHQNADVKVTAQPLSGSGASVGGQQYSGKEVVDKGVGYAPFAIAYNDKINQQLADKGAGGDQIVSGFAKDVVPPAREGSLGLYGFYDAKGKPIQGGNGQTPHDTRSHTEYGTFVRLVSPTVTVTHPDGKTEKKPLGDIYQYARYTPTPKTTPGAVEAPTEADTSTQVAQYTPAKPKPGRQQFLGRIQDFLDQFKA